MSTIDRKKLHHLHERESQRFLAEHPTSAALYARAQSSLLGGVPMNWMKKWAGAFPVFVKSAKGAHFTDVDGREYIDLCLGDTGAMTSHSPDRRFPLGRRRSPAPLRPSLLAIHAHRHRRQSLRHSNRSRNHPALEGPR